MLANSYLSISKSFKSGKSSFSLSTDKYFIKNLSAKLYQWTKDRWIISLSKESGMPSKKEKEN